MSSCDFDVPLNDSTDCHGSVNLGNEILPASIHVRYGESVNLRCVVSGYPVSKINWLHNTRDLGPATFHEISQTSRMTTLQINVTIETAGVYQCISEFRDPDYRLLDNTQTSAPVTISAMAPRLISQLPEKVPNSFYSTSLLENDKSSVTIQCTFNSIPESVIVWYLDDEPIPIVDCLTPNSTKKDPFTVTYSLQIDLSRVCA